MQVAKGIGANSLDAERFADLVGKQVAECAGAGKLDVAVRITLLGAEQFGDHRGAVRIRDAFRNSDRAEAVLLVNAFHIAEKLVHFKGALGDVNQVRTVVDILASQGGRGGEESRVTTHHHADVNALQRTVVEVDAGEGLGDKAGCGAEARAVVVLLEIVVDGLGNVNGAQLVVRFLRLLVDDAYRVGRIIAADVEEVADVVGLHHLEHPCAVFFIGLVAGGKQARGRRAGHLLEVVGGLASEIDEVFIDDAAHAVDGSIDGGHLAELAGLKGDAYNALIDDRGGATTLRDKYFSE